MAELQSTGSSLDYINLISESFFGHIIDATDTFLELFSNHSFEISNQKVLELDPLILSHLTEWIQSQITSFVKMILTQIKIGVGEKSSSTSMQLRLIMSTITTTTTAISNNSYIGTKDVSSRSRGASNEAPYNSYKSSDINGDHSPKGSNEGKENNDEVAYLKLKCEGPLLFLSQCLEILCSRATKLDSLNLQGKPCVCLYLVPELLHLVEAYGESIIRETYHLIQSETWLELENSSFLSVLTPSVHQNTLREKKNEVNSKKKRMCNSYTWLVNALTYFLGKLTFIFIDIFIV